MYKALKITLGIVFVVLIIAITALYFSLNSIVAFGIRTVGAQAAGTKVEVESVNISPFEGSVKIKGLCIANPKGYHSDKAFVLGSFFMDLNLKSIFTEKIIINNIIVDDIKVNYEPSAAKYSNLQEIRDNISKYSASSGEKKDVVVDKKKESGKKVVIKYFVIKNGTISVSVSLLKSVVNVPMPKIEMRDVGEGENKSTADIFGEIYDQTLKGISSTASNVISSGISETPAKLEKGVSDGLKSLQSSIGL